MSSSHSRRKQYKVLGIPRKYLGIVFGAVAIVVVAGIFLTANVSTAGYVPEVKGAPSLKVEQPYVDLGTMHWNQPAKVSYVLHNVGDQPLRITETPTIQVKEGCCPPTPELSAVTIRPGGTATITIRFMMHEGMDGPHDYRIQVKTNDPANPITELVAISNWVQ